MPRRRGRQRAPGGTARGRRPRDDMDDWLETDENPTERLRRDEDGKAQRLAEQFRARWHPNGNAAGGGPVQPVDALLNELRTRPNRPANSRTGCWTRWSGPAGPASACSWWSTGTALLTTTRHGMP